MIDTARREPNNHQAVNPTDTNLYAWLTGEDHIVNVGTERRSYIFDSEDSESGTFSNTKRNATSDIFHLRVRGILFIMEVHKLLALL